MKSDVNGCSTCPVGEEQYEEFYTLYKRIRGVQYDYRAPNGKLFSCIAKSLEEARMKRDMWLKEQNINESVV